jgi:hypothetical protein
MIAHAKGLRMMGPITMQDRRLSSSEKNNAGSADEQQPDQEKNMRYYAFRPKEFLKDYGKIGAGVYFSIYATVFWSAFTIFHFDLISLAQYGYDPESLLCQVQ